MATLQEKLRNRAAEIGRAVVRSEDEIEAGAFCEIELMREAANALDAVEALQEEDLVLFRAAVKRRQLLNRACQLKEEIAAIDAAFFPDTK